MITTISVTRNWQIHIPKHLRSYLGLHKPTKIIARGEKDYIVLKPATSVILPMGGKYERIYKQKKIKLESIRDKIDYSNI